MQAIYQAFSTCRQYTQSFAASTQSAAAACTAPIFAFGSEVWILSIQPLHNRYIAPLKISDYAFLSAALATAIAITTLSVAFFSIGALPLGAGAGTLVLMGAWAVMQDRLNHYFNEKAAPLVEKIKTAISGLSCDEMPSENATNCIFQNIKDLKEMAKAGPREGSFLTLETEMNAFLQNFIAQTPQQREASRALFLQRIDQLF